MLAPLDALRDMLAAVMPPALAEFLIVIAVAMIVAVIHAAIPKTWHMLEPKSFALQLLLGTLLFLGSIIAFVAYFVVPIALVITWPGALFNAIGDAWPGGFLGFLGVVAYILVIIGLIYSPWVTVVPKFHEPFWKHLRQSVAFMVYWLIVGTPLGMIAIAAYRKPDLLVPSARGLAEGLPILAILAILGVAGWLLWRYGEARRWLAMTVAVGASGILLFNTLFSAQHERFSAAGAAGFFAFALASWAWVYLESKRRPRPDTAFLLRLGIPQLGPGDWKSEPPSALAVNPA